MGTRSVQGLNRACGFGLLALVLLTLGAAAPAPAAGVLAKPVARAAAVAKADGFATAHKWADSSRIGRCQRRSPSRFACAGTIRGERRVCVVSVVINGGGGEPSAQLRRGKCHAIAPSPAATTRLGVHISPDPSRDLGDPFRVTYSYGASAISEVPGDPSSARPAPLPAGTLSLYSDGLLECSVGVTEAAPEWTCPVEYLALGTHHLTATYTAGPQAASAALVDDVGRLGTSFSLSASYEPLREAILTGRPEGCEEELPCEFKAGTMPPVELEIGRLEVSASTVSPWGTMPKSACPVGDATCAKFDLSFGNPDPIEVLVQADVVVSHDQVVEEGEPLDAEMLPPQSVFLAESGLGQLPVPEVEDGTYHFQASSGPRPGFEESEVSTPIRFTPAAIPLVKYGR